jgi:hypothetical protein
MKRSERATVAAFAPPTVEMQVNSTEKLRGCPMKPFRVAKSYISSPLACYFDMIFISFPAMSGEETLYVPVMIDCCKAATFSVRTSLPDKARAAKLRTLLNSPSSAGIAPSDGL